MRHPPALLRFGAILQRRLGGLLVWGAVALNLAVAWWPRHFPYQDSTNHLARYVLIGNALFGTPATFVQLRPIATPYVGVDALGAVLSHVLGPEATLRIIVGLALCALPVGMYCLLRVTAPDRTGWAVVGALLGFNGFLLIGFLSYVIGTGLALCWLAAWWPHRSAPSVARTAALMAGTVGLFYVHLAAALLVVVVAWLGALPLDRRSAERPPDRRFRPSSALLLAVAVTAAVILPWILWQVAARRAGIVPVSTLILASPWSKIRGLSFPFEGFSHAQGQVLQAGYELSLLALLYILLRARSLRRPDVILAAAGACVALYALFPVGIGATYYIDVRWLLPALLLPFCCSLPASSRATRGALVVPATALIVHAIVVHQKTVTIDGRLRAFERTLAQVPPGASVLPLVTDHGQYAIHFSPFRHFALWHTIHAGGHVPGLLAADGQWDHQPPHEFFAHFREVPRLYYPTERWGTLEFFPLDWHRLTADYEYIIQAGDDGRARALIVDGAAEIARNGEIVLYRVRSAAADERDAADGASSPLLVHAVERVVRRD